MINGIHALICNKEAEKLRAFFSDILGFGAVDAGQGWLIFALPPAELGVHPTDGKGSHELYLMCDDLAATLKDLKAKKVKVSEVNEQRWGSVATFALPGGGKIGIYQPKHPSPLQLKG